MEIERKWMVNGWPEGLEMREEYAMRQGYLTVRPTVRIREESSSDGTTAYVLCFKSGSGIARKEIELNIPQDTFRELEDMIGLPLIPKVRRTYMLPDGLFLEVNHVDEGQPSEFWYAEIEYNSIEEARAWSAPESLAEYLADDVTDEPGQTMGAYWLLTRAGEQDI